MDPRVSQHSEPMGIVLSALRFSSQKHRDQRRKDPESSPYINHPIDVANILFLEGGVRDHYVLAAAILHDTVEDTLTTLDELADIFGTHIATIVAEVTDDTSLPKVERKQSQINRAPFISHDAKLIKLADKISNLRDIHRCAPLNWSEERQVAYFRWAQAVVDGLRGTNRALESTFDSVCAEFFKAQTAAD